MDYLAVVAGVEYYVKDLYNKAGIWFPYHNLDHTRNVVFHAKEIGSYCALDQTDTFIVTAAAWFHDTGYFNGDVKGHEGRGADLAADFLEGYHVNAKIIDMIRRCIRATTLPQSPVSLLEEIVCDADLFHFGTEQLITQDRLMQKEAELRTGRKIARKDWLKGTVCLLESHRFHTPYCLDRLSEGKRLNLEAIQEALGY